MIKIVMFACLLFILTGCVGGEKKGEVIISNSLDEEENANEEIISEEKEVGEKINIEDLESSCNEKKGIDKIFYTFKGCGEEKETIYVYDGYGYSKEVYDKKYEEYSKKGPLCEEDLEKKTGDLRVECKKGKYANFYQGNDKITYEEYKKNILSSLDQAYEDEQDAYKKKLEAEWKDGVKDFDTFVEAVGDGVYAWIMIEEKGDECIYAGNWDYTKHGSNKQTGTKYLCKTGMIRAINYYVDNVEVSKSDYLREFYKKERERLGLID